MPTTAPATSPDRTLDRPSTWLPILAGRANATGYTAAEAAHPDTIIIELPNGSILRVRANDNTSRFDCMAFIDRGDLDAYLSGLPAGDVLQPTRLDDNPDMGTVLLRLINRTMTSVAWQLGR